MQESATAAGVSRSSRRDMSYTRSRRDTRYDYPSTIEYVMGAHTDEEAVHKGVAVNLSITGLGMYIFDLLPDGQQITIKTALPVDSRTAALCWIRKEDENFYRAGLKFL
jgi:c-di-GMP-binding flagellar brake protein YcgR